MRTTIDLPADLHQVLRSVARDRHETLSQTASALLRRTLMPDDGIVVEHGGRSGLPVVRVGRVVTAEDVRRLEDEA